MRYSLYRVPERAAYGGRYRPADALADLRINGAGRVACPVRECFRDLVWLHGGERYMCGVLVVVSAWGRLFYLSIYLSSLHLRFKICAS